MADKAIGPVDIKFLVVGNYFHRGDRLEALDLRPTLPAFPVFLKRFW